MRKPIIVGNWKMNKTMKETKEFMEAVDGVAASDKDVYKRQVYVLYLHHMWNVK